jgi:glutathione S-transferase
LLHADIAVACAYRFVQEAQPSLCDASQFPALSALSARAEALPAFREIYLPITNNLNKS